jgi:hypothetical protein
MPGNHPKESIQQMEKTVCSETLADKTQRPENNPKAKYKIQNTAKV